MAFEQNLRSLTLLAAADLRTKQYCFVTVGSGGTVALTGAAGNADGVLQNKPNSGEAAQIAFAGVTKIVSSASANLGAAVGSAANGQARTALQHDYQIGRLLEAPTDANQIVTMLIVRGGYKP